jgi:hypothetical protein
MVAWNIVLGHLKKANDPEQQHEDGEAVFRVAEAERGPMAAKAVNRSRLTGAAVTGRNSIGEMVNTAMARTSSHAIQRKKTLGVMVGG